MKDSNGKFIATSTKYIVDCLSPCVFKNGHTRLKWMHGVLSVGETVGEMVNHARHFSGVKKWRVSGRYIYRQGDITGHRLPVSRAENEIISTALFAASKK